MTRKPRKKPKSRAKLDYMKPMTLKDFGSENDPCFGKHYDLRAEECSRCGDYEACAILSQNNMLKDMSKQEEKHRFKDKEEGALIDEQNKWVKKLMVKKAKAKPNTWLKFESLVPKFREHCNLTDIEDNNLYQRIQSAAKASKYLRTKDGKYKLKGND